MRLRGSRDLDAGRPRVREEDARERIGCDADQLGGEGFGGLVRPAREDKLVELFGLGADRGHDARVRVAVGGDPPRGDGVDPALAIGGVEFGVLGVRNQRNGVAETVLGERVPDGGGHMGTILFRHSREGGNPA